MHVNMNHRRVWVVDSLYQQTMTGGIREYYTKIWLQYMTDVLIDVKGQVINQNDVEDMLEDWLQPEESKRISHQLNGFDCGAYVLMYIFHVSLQREPIFSQVDVTSLRDKMIYLLLQNFEEGLGLKSKVT